MWQMILALAGAGMLGRTALGFMENMRPAPTFEPSPSFQQVDIPLPNEEEEQKKAADSSNLYDKLVNTTSGLPWGESWFWGKGSSTPGTVPALWTIGAPSAILAGFGGWKLVDAIMDWRRKSQLENELSGKKREYARLLEETTSKHASDEAGIEAELDELADMATRGVEKSAAVTDAWNAGLSALLFYSVLSSLMGGKLSYDYFKKRNQRRIAEEALRRRAKERFGGVTPVHLQAVPEPI